MCISLANVLVSCVPVQGLRVQNLYFFSKILFAMIINLRSEWFAEEQQFTHELSILTF